MSAPRRRRIHDVTYTLSERLPVWPGDPPVRLARPARISKGDPANVTRLDIGSHTGTHVDVPRHMIDGAPTIDRIPIDRWIGPCRVVAVDAPVITAALLRGVDLAGVRKVLFKTRSSGKLRSREFDTAYVGLDPSAARHLVKLGIDLVGIDYLSIEEYHRKDFPAHKVLMARGVLIVEGLDLSRIPPGDYELLCFPLRIAGGDGAPARVALRELA